MTYSVTRVFFTGDSFGDGWTWNELQWYYGAPVSALSYEQNFFRLKIVGGQPSKLPNGVNVETDLTDVRDIEAIGVRRKPGSNQIYVWGEGANLESRLAVNDPPLLAASVLKEKLEAAGISVSGKARTLDWSTSKGIKGLQEVAKIDGPDLSFFVSETNRKSVNLYPELMLRELGKRFGKEAPDPNPKLNRLRGHDIAGAAYLKKWLEEKTGRGARLSISDGSGLSSYNLVTTEALVRVLIETTRSNYKSVFSDSLAVAGKSGTLKRRLGNLRGRIVAKTGTVKHVNSLAGFIRGGKRNLIFAIVVNNETTRNDSNTTIDEIVTDLAG